MRIAFILPPDHAALVGGHAVARTKTQEALEARGHQVAVLADVTALPAHDFDVLHFWTRDAAQIRQASAYALPQVLTPIYIAEAWVRRFVAETAGKRRFYGGLARSAVAHGVQAILGRPQGRSRAQELADAIRACDLFLPNSQAEAAAVYADTGVHTPSCIIPNAADPAFAHARADPFVAAYGVRDFVLCVARFEPLKNQLGLLRALRGTACVLVLVGAPHPAHPAYFRHCQAQFGPQVLYLPHMPPAQLASIYAAARVSVLPSFFETTGLVSLEAGLAGCNVVSTDRGYTREYFEDLVWYCDPSSPASIRRAVVGAFEAPVTPALREKIMRCYTWDIAADRTIAAYKRAMELRASPSRGLGRKEPAGAL